MKYVTDAASKFLKTQSTAPISTKTENKGAQELLFKVINEEISGDITALLKQGANPYIKDEKGHTAFDYAIKANNLKAAHIMYQSGSNEEYKELLAGYTITQLETSKNDFAAFNQVVAYSEKSNIPEIRAHAEELMYNQSIRLYIISDNQLDKYLEDNPNILLYDNVNKSVPSTVDNLHKNGYLNIIPDNKIEAELNNFLIENKINIDNIANKFLQEQKIYKNLPKDISGYTEEEKSAFINDHKREIFFHHNNAITEEDLRKISPNIKLKEFLIKHKINIDKNLSKNPNKKFYKILKTAEIETEIRIQHCNKFLEKSPLLGSNLDNGLAKSIVDFSLENFKKSPDLLIQTVNLIKKQNQNSPKLLEKLASELAEYSNKNASTLSEVTMIDGLIQDLTIKAVANYKFGSLTVEDKEALTTLENFTQHKSETLSGNIDEQRLIDLHQVAQSFQGKAPLKFKDYLDEDIKKSSKKQYSEQEIDKLAEKWEKIRSESISATKLPTKLQSKINLNLTQATIQYFEKQIKDGNINAISKMSEIAAETQAYMGFVFDAKIPINDKATLEEFHTLKAAKYILGETEENIETKKLEKFGRLLDKKPMLGSNPIDNSYSLGEYATKIALNHADTHPELLIKVTQLIKEQHPNDPATLYAFTDSLMTGANQNDNNEKRRKAITGILKSELSTYLSFESSTDAHALIKEAAAAAHNELLSDLILANKDKHKLQLEFNQLDSLHKDGYKDATKALLFDSDAVNNYIAAAPKKANHELIRFIYENKDNKSITLNESSITTLIDSALKQEDEKMLIKVMEDVAAKKEPNLVTEMMSKISINADHEKLNAAISATFSDDNPSLYKHKTILAKAVLSNDITIERLENENVNELAKFYEPSTGYSRFLHKLLDAHYTKDTEAKNLCDTINAHAPQLPGRDNDEYIAVLHAYLKTKQGYEKKPWRTRLKAWAAKKTLEDYKNDHLMERIVNIENIIKEPTDKFEEKIPVPKPKKFQALKKFLGIGKKPSVISLSEADDKNITSPHTPTDNLPNHKDHSRLGN